jgi:hypothetical protein
MNAKAAMGTCPNCRKQDFIMPLHGEAGGPPMCLQCGMDWHAKHTRRRKFGRIVAKAVRLYLENGGKSSDVKAIVDTVSFAKVGLMLGPDLDPLGYAADTIGADVGDISTELLADILQLTHPDHHPPERQDLAKRVTQQLLALKPFVFPAPKPKPARPMTPPKPRDASVNVAAATDKKPSQPAYPCQLCAETVPYFYCAPCKAEYQKREEQKREKARAKQREQYARRQRRRRAMRPPKPCEICGAKIEAKRRDAKHCSPACRQKAHRQRVTALCGPRARPQESRNCKAKPLSPAAAAVEAAFAEVFAGIGLEFPPVERRRTAA